jgi:hypothetical protein
MYGFRLNPPYQFLVGSKEFGTWIFEKKKLALDHTKSYLSILGPWQPHEQYGQHFLNSQLFSSSLMGQKSKNDFLFSLMAEKERNRKHSQDYANTKSPKGFRTYRIKINQGIHHFDIL